MAIERGARAGYKVWAVDDVVYGPVDIATVIQWIKEERVLVTTWIFSVANEKWAKAGAMPELASLFSGPPKQTPHAANGETSLLISGIRPGALRRVKIFAEMSDQHLGRFVQMMEIVPVPAFREVMRKDSPGDSMYAVLEGELRARLIIGAKESTLATYQAGDIFGEMCLFDDGTRSADVLANKDSILLRISAARFKDMCQSHPELSTPFLLALGRTLSGRVRNDNRRIGELVSLSRAGH